MLLHNRAGWSRVFRQLYQDKLRDIVRFVGRMYEVDEDGVTALWNLEGGVPLCKVACLLCYNYPVALP